MNPEEARALLGSAPVARLATVDGAGRPHLVPVTFALDGERIYTAVDHKPKTTVALRRLANIRAHPEVTLLADHYEDDWTRLWWVRADGAARVVDDPAAMAVPLDLLVTRYHQYENQRPTGPLIEIEVRRWTGWAYSSGVS